MTARGWALAGAAAAAAVVGVLTWVGAGAIARQEYTRETGGGS